MNKVIFVKFSPLSQKMYEDLCLQSIVDNGYIVEYWDTSMLFSFETSDMEPFNPNNNIFIKVIHSFKDLDESISYNRNALYVILMTTNFSQIRILRLLSRYNCVMCFWGPAPVLYLKNDFTKRLERITLEKLLWFVKHQFTKMLFCLRFIKVFEYYFKVGRLGDMSLGSIGNSMKNHIKALQINSSDFNRFRYNDDVCNSNYTKFIVFVDQYYPFHPDMTMAGIEHIPSDLYYSQLNNTFERLEKKFGMPVIISAHPKALRYKEHNYFEGRSVNFGKTMELVKNASVVLCHDSTAISYAIMCKKRIITLNSSLIQKYYPENFTNIQNYAKHFGLSSIDMGTCNGSNGQIHLEDKLTKEQVQKYNDFIYDYCTSPFINESNETLVVNYINSIMSCNK